MSEPSTKVQWPLSNIADCTRIVSGGTPKTSEPLYWEGNVNWATPKDISDLDGYPFLDSTPRTLTALGLASCSAEVLPPRSVLFSSRAPIGLVAINRIPVATNQGFKSFIPDTSRLDAGFLYHWLRANRSFLESLGTGATFKEISKTVMMRVQIPLPPLDEQRRIASVLDKADALRRQRQESLQSTEQLLQSIFIDMFGDLKGNNVKTYSFEELALPRRGMFSNGPFGSDLLTSELQNTGVPVIYIRDIRNGDFSWKSNVYVSHEKAATLPFCEVKPNDLLISKVGDPPGVAALYPLSQTPAIITQDVIRVRVNPDIAQPAFLQHCLNSETGRRLIQTITVKGTRSRFSLGDLKKLEIPIPKLELQNAFVGAATRILELRSLSRDSSESLNDLFSSIQRRAFRGELDLSLLNLDPEDAVLVVTPTTEPVAVQSRYKRPGCFIAPPEIEAQMLLLEEKLDNGSGDSISWNENYFKYRILSQVLQAPFSFSQIWEAVVRDIEEPSVQADIEFDIEYSLYKTVRDTIFRYVEEGTLKQQFDENNKEIVFSPRT